MSSENRGTKRKHSELTTQDPATRVKGKLHHSTKEVKKAAKKAKIFETQKAIKRLKDTRKKNPHSDDISSIEAELKYLKDVDHEYIALVALSSKLKKTKLLHDHPAVQDAISQELHLPSPKTHLDALDGKVQSRLLSSKILAEEIHSVIEDLKNLLAPKLQSDDVSPEDEATEPPKKTKNKPKLTTAPSTIESPVRSGEEAEDEAEGEDQEELDTAEAFSDDEVDDAGWESGTVDDDEGPEEDGWESGSIPDGENESLASSDEEVEDSAEPPQKRTKPTKSAVSTKPSGASSTFLPSLSVGYIQGSDDSDFSDSEAKIADPEIKKNRRGQRARRAIWEKKYGRNANHKKKEVAENKAAMRVAAAAKAGGRPRMARHGPQSFDPKNQTADRGWAGRGNTQKSSTHAPAQDQKRSTEQKALHPSWEAKRKQKEKEGIIPSQGKKIVF